MFQTAGSKLSSLAAERGQGPGPAGQRGRGLHQPLGHRGQGLEEEDNNEDVVDGGVEDDNDEDGEDRNDLEEEDKI